MIGLLLVLPALAMAGPVAQLLPRACNSDNCLRAVKASTFPARMGAMDCSSFLRATVTPAVSTVTSTLSFSVTSTVTSGVTISTIVPVTETTTVHVTATATSDVTVSTTIPVTTTATDEETATTSTTTTVFPLGKRQVTVVPSSIPTYASACSGAARYSSACSCIGVTATTITAATPLTTTTISQTVTPVTFTAVTTVETDSITTTANTVSVTTTDSTATVTTVVETDSITTVANTVTVTTTDATTTVVATTTAAPVCGVNLALNGDFPAPQYAPFVETSTGNAAPQFNSGCGADPYCPLFIINNGGGSETLTQTISTFPGQTYTISFLYNNFGASAGASLSCSVNVAGSTPAIANLHTVTGTRFVLASGSFKATGLSTVLTCAGSTGGNMASNIQAIHVEC